MALETCPQCRTPRESAASAFCTTCGTPFGAPAPQPGGEPDAGSTQVLPQQEQPWGQQPPPQGQQWGQQQPWDQQGGQPGGQPFGQPGGQQWSDPAYAAQQGGQPGGPPGGPQGGQWGGPAQPPPGQWGAAPGGPGGPGQPGGPWQQGPGGGNGGGKGGKIALIIGLVVLLLAAVGITLALVLGGDDGDKDADSSPESASKEEFCEVADKYGALNEDDWSEAADIADEAAEVGTPEDIPEGARRGFVIALDILGKAGDEDEADDLADDLSEKEEGDLTAFFAYVGTTCSGLDSSTDVPSVEVPSELELPTPPTDLPSELLTMNPSDFLSDLPSDLLSELPSDLLTQLPSEFATP